MYDEETALYYLRSRYYNVLISRFLNSDSRFSFHSLFAYSLFAYCNNNPIVLADTDGRDSDPAVRTKIHNAVCAEVVKDINSSMGWSEARTAKGMKIDYYSRGYGLADVIAKHEQTYYIYEIKRCTISLNSAYTQISKYIRGTWHDGIHLSVYMKINPNIYGCFPYEYNGKTYTVVYEDIGNGVIYYDYEEDGDEKRNKDYSLDGDKIAEYGGTAFLSLLLVVLWEALGGIMYPQGAPACYPLLLMPDDEAVTG